MNETTPVVYTAAPPPMQLDEIRRHVGLVQQVQREVMKEGEHYGVIPGTKGKPALLKPGAEILVLTFRLVPETVVTIIELEGDHREYRAITRLSSINGLFLGNGAGSCSTMETKYRYRGQQVELTDNLVPSKYWDLRREGKHEEAQAMLGGRGYKAVKDDAYNRWVIAQTTGEKQENPNPADEWNTCLKMAEKRSLVDAILRVTACSDSFTQDVDEEVVDHSTSKTTTTEEKTETKPPPKTTAKATTKVADKPSGKTADGPPPGHPAADTPNQGEAKKTPPKGATGTSTATATTTNGKVTLDVWLDRTKREIERTVSDAEALTVLRDRLAPWKSTQLAKLDSAEAWLAYCQTAHSGKAMAAYVTALLAERARQENLAAEGASS